MMKTNSQFPQIFGDFEESITQSEESLSMVFSPSHLPLKRRWENNGLSADFIADYFKTFYATSQEEKGEPSDEYVIENLRDAVKYVANELLENAMKFQDSSLPFTAQIRLSLHEDKLIFCITNSVKQSQANSLLKFINTLLAHDPQELYIEAMRNSAKDENQGHSGMGLLSMICDYAATLSWKFEISHDIPDTIIVSTMVKLET